jgi:hypothetical protein
MIELKVIEGEHTLTCPSCSTVRMAVTTTEASVPGDGYFLTDGDTIGGLYEALVSAGLENALPKGDLTAWDKVNYDYTLLVGDCSACGDEYYVIEASLMDDRVAVDFYFVNAYFYRNLPIAEPTYQLATFEDKSWLVTRHETELGTCLTHQFGPFGLFGKTMKGPFGVSACAGGKTQWDFARDFLLKIWPDLKQLARDVNDAARLQQEGQHDV